MRAIISTLIKASDLVVWFTIAVACGVLLGTGGTAYMVVVQ